MPPTSRRSAFLPPLTFLLGVAVAALIAQAPYALGTTTDTHRQSRGQAVSCGLDPAQCQAARDAIASIPYPWFVLGYEVDIQAPPDSWYQGKTVHDQNRIELYMDRDTTVDDLGRTFAHEVAHAILHTCGDERLDAWRDRRELPASVPDTVDAPHDFDSVSEDAAEAFAQYMTGQPSRSTVGDEVTDDWLQRNADLFVLCGTDP